jgi:hypothetical protein
LNLKHPATRQACPARGRWTFAGPTTFCGFNECMKEGNRTARYSCRKHGARGCDLFMPSRPRYLGSVVVPPPPVIGKQRHHFISSTSPRSLRSFSPYGLGPGAPIRGDIPTNDILSGQGLHNALLRTAVAPACKPPGHQPWPYPVTNKRLTLCSDEKKRAFGDDISSYGCTAGAQL